MPNNDEQFSILLQQATPDLFEIRRLLQETETDSVTMIKMLSLIRNIQLVSGWGKVTILVQDKRPVTIEQEQTFKIDNSV